MTNVLVVLISKDGKFVRPFKLCADLDNLVERLKVESGQNQLVYCLYTTNDKRDLYIPYLYLFKGKSYTASNYIVRC